MDRVFLEDILHFNISVAALLSSNSSDIQNLAMHFVETPWVNKEVRM